MAFSRSYLRFIYNSKQPPVKASRMIQVLRSRKIMVNYQTKTVPTWKVLEALCYDEKYFIISILGKEIEASSIQRTKFQGIRQKISLVHL